MEVWPYGDIESIREKVSTEYLDVVNLLQRARFEMKAFQRSADPNTNSIIDMSQCQNMNIFFRALKVKDLNSSSLIVNDILVIDAKAFLQMTQEHRNILIEETEKLKTNQESDAISLSRDALLVCQKYRLNFGKPREDGIQSILKALNVKSTEELTFGQIQFSKLDPNDVDRVIQVFKEAGKVYNEKCSIVIRKMAERFMVDNVIDFVAVASYAVRRIKEKTASLQKENPNPAEKSQNTKSIDYYLDRVVDTFIMNKNGYQDTICDEFQNLLNNCVEHYPENGLRFKTLMAAANHYDKHSREFPRSDNNEPFSPEIYFQMAREMCSKPEENPMWTQDGSSISWQFKRNGAIAVRYDNPYKGTAVIATLHKPKKN